MPTPPSAPRRPHHITQHGQTRVDDYFWLRERDNPDVLAYLHAENTYTEAILAHTQPLQDRLFHEMKGRIKETDAHVPAKIDDYFYYWRETAGKQYPIHCRKRHSLDAPEEVLLDENELAEGHSYFRIGAFRVSPDHRLLAYSTDTDGDEVYTLVVKDLATGELLPDRIPGTYYGVEWAADNATLFYVTLDHAKRPYRVHRHVAGGDAMNDAVVFEERDEQFFVSVGKSASKRYLLITLWAFDIGEVWTLPADEPAGQFTVFQPRQKGVEYTIDHGSAGFTIVTNEGARNFKLMLAPDLGTPKSQWRTLTPHRDDVYLEFVLHARDFMVRSERQGGLRRLRVTDPLGMHEREIAFPEPAYAVWPHQNEDFDSDELRLTYESMITPEQTVDVNLRAHTWTVRKEREIPSGYDRSRYRTERIEAVASDGARVPVSLVYKAGAFDRGPAPLLLYGYGAYGARIEPGFDAHRLSLLDRGVVYALAHIRGGGELGRAWYDDGKLLKKKNSFTDFIASAEHLIAQGITSPDRLAAMGGSAGGLLIGAVVTMRPDLFRTAVAAVPFVDVINTMSDPTIPLTVPEWTQWGNPDDPAYFEYMLSYSPYDNVAPMQYPDLLVTAGLNDPRVQYWEPAKWVARLRATKAGDSWLLLKTDMDVGHGGPSGRYDALKEEALIYAFLLDRLGIEA